MDQLGELSFREINMLIGGVIFAIVMAAFLFNVMKGIRRWSFNNSQPLESESAIVKSRRTNVVGGSNDTTRTDYFVTFELVNGDRMEFEVKPEVFGQLVEDDQGKLLYQGTRYLGFERQKNRGTI
ncbi:DUF2500 domain-containing protein [Fictibacillus barbaricus]|uniref:DUF2500 domain-containing protein n=1 Tax=Fictibacillus barbaricus TaxID=182136 RepID=A0ABU1TVX5_9BACL|nr:DUF2500 domain-containing protein [Fictibacillus barbaricus]MDR7071361.1 hypothetical protein [Fictibacillus barbaricus]